MVHEQPPEQKDDPAVTWLVWGIGALGTLAVIGIAGVCYAAMPRSHHRPPSPLTLCKSNLKNIGTAYEMYSTDYGGKYPPNVGLLTPNYLRSLPECPNAGRLTYKVLSGPRAPMNTESYNDYYYIECFGSNHKDRNIFGNFPAYNSVMGLIERPPGNSSRERHSSSLGK